MRSSLPLLAVLAGAALADSALAQDEPRPSPPRPTDPPPSYPPPPDSPPPSYSPPPGYPPPGYPPSGYPPSGYPPSGQPPSGYPSPPAVSQQAAADPESGLRFKVSIGPTYRSLYGISFVGGDLHLVLGGQSGHLAFYGAIEGFFGATTFGLATMRVSGAFHFEGVLGGRFRLGGGPRLGMLAIRRVTTGNALVDGFFGVGLYGSYDLARWGPRALFLQLRIGADLFAVFSDNGSSSVPVMLDVGASLGFRL